MASEKAALSRRAVMAGAGALVVTAAAATTAAQWGRVDPISRKMRELLRLRPRPVSLATAEVEDWMAASGAQFTVAGYRLRLAGVRRLQAGERPEGLRQQPFVAVFDLLSRARLPGDLIYTIAHPDYGSFDIFLTNAPLPWFPRRMHAVFG